jgi:hypothetical protein
MLVGLFLSVLYAGQFVNPLLIVAIMMVHRDTPELLGKVVPSQLSLDQAYNIVIAIEQYEQHRASTPIAVL